jgi:hypothetical protein
MATLEIILPIRHDAGLALQDITVAAHAECTSRAVDPWASLSAAAARCQPQLPLSGGRGVTVMVIVGRPTGAAPPMPRTAILAKSIPLSSFPGSLPGPSGWHRAGYSARHGSPWCGDERA